MKNCITITFLILNFLALSLCGVQAALPPWVYDEWRQSAEEVHVIQVTNSTTVRVSPPGSCLVNEVFVVTALILQVSRTLVSLQEGDTIEFETLDRYRTTNACTWPPGPSAPGRLDSGWCGKGYFNHTMNSGSGSGSGTASILLILGAGGESFEKMPCYDTTPVTEDMNDSTATTFVPITSSPRTNTTSPAKFNSVGVSLVLVGAVTTLFWL